MAENSAMPTDAQPTSTTPPSHGLLNAAKPTAATDPAPADQSRPRAVANSPSASA
jgi:hypothetical protein